MILIQKTLVDEPVASINFACDLKACKGACCTMPGGRGAPLEDSEIEEIERSFPAIRKYLSKDHLARIEQLGLVEGTTGDHTTPCYDKRACVFVAYENGIAKCSFEKAYFNGEISWRKPISCHLFPLRIDRGARELVRYEFLAECQPALERGRIEHIALSGFLKEALLRAYGEQWYREFLATCDSWRERRLTANEKLVQL